MRKITSKEEEAKKSKKNQVIIGLVLIGIMFASILGFTTNFGGGLGHGGNNNGQNGETRFSYNGFYFILGGGNLWFVEIQPGLSFAFTNLPGSVKDFEVYGLNQLQLYSGQPLYISSKNFNAESEITRNLGLIAQRIQKACLEGETCDDETLPIKTCNDNFIIIRDSEVSNIFQSENCVFIEGPFQDQVALADKFLYEVIGIL